MIKLKVSFWIVLALLLSSCEGGEMIDNTTTPPVQEVIPEEETKDEPTAGVIRDISSMELVSEMGVGWNLGNAFDVQSKDKTVWGNPLPSSTQIRAAKDMGFTTLRIPITWEFHQEDRDPYTIETPYLGRIKLIVEEGLRNNMHVIINTHHDEWIIPTNEDADVVKARLTSLWTQVATYFKDYGDRLIFEILNEPRLRGSAKEWSGGTAEGRQIINELHQLSVDAIRATGDNNSKRHIMVSTYAASSHPDAMNELVIPDDPNIIVSVHSYFPWSFCGQDSGGTNIWGSDEEKSALDAELDRIKERWVIQENRPIILGEYGSKDKNNLSARVEYGAYYTKSAVARGMVPIIWDDGGDFGLYDRHAMSWKYPEIAEAVVNAAQ